MSEASGINHNIIQTPPRSNPNVNVKNETTATERESKVDQVKSETLPANITKSAAKPADFKAVRTSHAEVYKSNLMQRITLGLFLRNEVFGSPEQLSEKNVKSQYRLMIAGVGEGYGADLKTDKVEIQVGNKKIVGHQFSKKDDSTKSEERPTALIITGSFGPSGKYAAPLARAYLDKGYNVLVIDPVGFGESQKAGKPTPENFMQSAEAGMQYVQENMQKDNGKIIVHGYSLGGFAAAHLGGLDENKGVHVVLDRVGASTGKIAQNAMGSTIGKIAGSLTQAVVPFDLEKTLPAIKGKLLVVQADWTPTDSGHSDKSDLLVEGMVKANKIAVNTKIVSQEGDHITEYKETWTQKTDSPAFSTWDKFVVSVHNSQGETVIKAQPRLPPAGA